MLSCLFSVKALGRVVKVIVSGADPAGVGHTEASATAAVLMDIGVPADAILQESQATTTAENAWFILRWIPKGTGKVFIITSDFHIARATYIFQVPWFQIEKIEWRDSSKRAKCCCLVEFVVLEECTWPNAAVFRIVWPKFMFESKSILVTGGICSLLSLTRGDVSKLRRIILWPEMHQWMCLLLLVYCRPSMSINYVGLKTMRLCARYLTNWSKLFSNSLNLRWCTQKKYLQFPWVANFERNDVACFFQGNDVRWKSSSKRYPRLEVIQAPTASVWAKKIQPVPPWKIILWTPWMMVWKMILLTSSTTQGGGGSFKNRKDTGEIGCCESRMAEQKHWWIELSNCLADKLTNRLTISLTKCLAD